MWIEYIRIRVRESARENEHYGSKQMREIYNNYTNIYKLI